MATLSWIGYILSALPGVASLYILWKKWKTEQPKIDFNFVKSSYKIDESKEKNDLILITKILFENKGNAAGSVTDLIAMIRYSERAIKMYPFVYGMLDELALSQRPLDYEEIFPLEVSPYGSKTIKVIFKFNKVYPDFLDRCGVSIDIKNPKKWDWKDLPILVRFIANTTNSKIESNCCIFREDLSESQKISGTINVIEESNSLRDFTPKIEFD